jgi:hypothetical protein
MTIKDSRQSLFMVFTSELLQGISVQSRIPKTCSKMEEQKLGALFERAPDPPSLVWG